MQVGTVAAFEDIENVKISRADFMHALDEVQPAFGVSEEELQAVVENGIIHYSQRIDVGLTVPRATNSSSGHSQRRESSCRAGAKLRSHSSCLRTAAR